MTATDGAEGPELGINVELKDPENTPIEPAAAVERGTEAGTVPIGTLVLKATGILLAGAVPVGRNAVEFALVLEMDPLRGPSDAEKLPVAGMDDEPVPTGAVTRGAEGPGVPRGAVALKGTPVLNGTEVTVRGVVSGSDEFTVEAESVPDKVMLLIETERETDVEVRVLKRPLLSPNSFSNSGPVLLPLAVGNTALEFTDSGGRVTDASPKPPLAVGKSVLEFAKSGGNEAEELPVGAIALEFVKRGGMVREGLSAPLLAVASSMLELPGRDDTVAEV